MSFSGDIRIVISCEHAGNDVPADYRYLFSEDEAVLSTHLGYDIGALEIARFLGDGLKADLYYTTISRLLIEANRSKDNPQLFSDYTARLGQSMKDKILANFYTPYRQKLEAAIAAGGAKRVIHLSIHSFTPILNGETRKADIGVLYDPSRKYESAVAEKLIEELKKASTDLIILPNSPYKGTDDGFTTYLRTLHSDESYCGIEIEINQKFFTDNEEKVEKIKSILLSAIRRAILSEG